MASAAWDEDAVEEPAHQGKTRVRPQDYRDYDSYLDAFVSPLDLRYLDAESARQLQEHRPPEQCLAVSRVAFEASRNQAEQEALAAARRNRFASEGCDVSQSPLLQALAEREPRVRAGALATIIFLRVAKGKQEISAFIDYKARLQSSAGLGAVFRGTERLLPHTSDLCYFCWTSRTITCHDSPSFQVRDDSDGLVFEHTQDHKVMSASLDAPSDSSCRRTELQTPDYAQVVLFDHDIRRH